MILTLKAESRVYLHPRCSASATGEYHSVQHMKWLQLFYGWGQLCKVRSWIYSPPNVGKISLGRINLWCFLETVIYKVWDKLLEIKWVWGWRIEAKPKGNHWVEQRERLKTTLFKKSSILFLSSWQWLVDGNFKGNGRHFGWIHLFTFLPRMRGEYWYHSNVCTINIKQMVVSFAVWLSLIWNLFTSTSKAH